MSAMMEATPGLNSAERSEESGNHVEDDVLRRRASEEGRETTSEARARAERFRLEMEARCEAVQAEAERANIETRERLETIAIDVKGDGYETIGSSMETTPPPATPVESTNFSKAETGLAVSADAEELVKALLKSQRERETLGEANGNNNTIGEEQIVESDGDDTLGGGESHVESITCGYHKAKLRDELAQIRSQVHEETLKLEKLRRETMELRTTREVTSSDEAVVKDKLTRTRTQLTLLENEQAQLAEDLEYQHKSSAVVRKACQDEEERLRSHLENLQIEIEEEEARLFQAKSDTKISVEILEEHEEYVDKVKRQLEGLEAAVESKTALLRELDDDQGSMEDELETLRMQMRKELEEAEMIRAKQEDDKQKTQAEMDALRKEVERLKDDQRRYQTDIERSQEALDEAVRLFQSAKDTAEREICWKTSSFSAPPSQSRHSVEMYDSAQNSPVSTPFGNKVALDVRPIRLFEDSSTNNHHEADFYCRMMMMEKAAKDAEARQAMAEASVKKTEARLRRMVDFINRASIRQCSSPSPSHGRSGYQTSINNASSYENKASAATECLDFPRSTAQSASKERAQIEQSFSRDRKVSQRAEFHNKLNELLDTISRARKL